MLDKGNLIYMDLEKDEDLFKGQGDYQFEIYRRMRRQIGKDWTASCPRTNLFVSLPPSLPSFFCRRPQLLISNFLFAPHL